MRKIKFRSYGEIGLIFLILSSVLGVAPASALDDGAKLAEQFIKKIPLNSYDQTMTLEQAMQILSVRERTAESSSSALRHKAQDPGQPKHQFGKDDQQQQSREHEEEQPDDPRHRAFH